ncbi:MAG: Hsp33 family molecular chaperone HslO, partial [Bacteroidota bacterium]
MNIENLKKQYKLRDRMVRAISKNGHFRVSVVKNSNTAKTAQDSHNLPDLPALFLARACSAAMLLASFLKGEERVVIEAEGNGPISKVFAEALQVGECRGFVDFSQDKSDWNISEISDALGVGVLKIARVLYNKPEPITGITELVKGDL